MTTSRAALRFGEVINPSLPPFLRFVFCTDALVNKAIYTCVSKYLSNIKCSSLLPLSREIQVARHIFGLERSSNFTLHALSLTITSYPTTTLSHQNTTSQPNRATTPLLLSPSFSAATRSFALHLQPRVFLPSLERSQIRGEG